MSFQLISSLQPSGDQPQAIKSIVDKINTGVSRQMMLGVTGSGKTFTMASIIEKVQKSTLIMAPNKILAAQLYTEFKNFFPNNAVEYFVSYYDYYRPEAYIPSSDLYIDKDSQINEEIERLRLSATKSLLTRTDVIVIASVSAIYGLGDPDDILKLTKTYSIGDTVDYHQLSHDLIHLNYKRQDSKERGTFQIKGDIINVFPPDDNHVFIHMDMNDTTIEKMMLCDSLTGEKIKSISNYTFFPKSNYIASSDRIEKATISIQHELKQQLSVFKKANKMEAYHRLKKRTEYDLEMMKEVGFCKGIENYAAHLSLNEKSSHPKTLFDYLPSDSLVFVDESHISIPQIQGMFKADQSRKQTLVDFGFRLPSAKENRPLTFHEWEDMLPQTVFVSATPGSYEYNQTHPQNRTELIVRPTGLCDPEIEVRSQTTQVTDVVNEIQHCVQKKERVLITTLTKKMAEDLTDYLHDQKIKAQYLHSHVETPERLQIIHNLRTGVIDVLIGINLLREGLDIPEVALVAVLDADKEGFLRTKESLIQTIGRAARHQHGRAILYANTQTKAIQETLNETNRRRQKQIKYNTTHHIVPSSVSKKMSTVFLTKGTTKTKEHQKSNSVQSVLFKDKKEKMSSIDKEKYCMELEKQMIMYAENLEFEKAGQIRDEIKKIRNS